MRQTETVPKRADLLRAAESLKRIAELSRDGADVSPDEATRSARLRDRLELAAEVLASATGRAGRPYRKDTQ
jgi:hypothetical protein